MDETALIHRAREAVARGDLDAARQLLVRLLYEQPGSETAWMMMATLVEQPDRKRDCLERALRLNPDNEVARAQLAALELPSPEAAAEAAEQPESTPAPEVAAPLEVPSPAEAELEPAVPAEGPLPSEVEPSALPESESAVEVEAGAAESAAPEEPQTVEVDAIPRSEPAAETAILEPGTAPAEQVSPQVEMEALAPQDTESKAPAAASPAASDLPPPEPEPEAGMVPFPKPAPVPAPLDDETATVLGNSFLIDNLAPGEQVLYRTTLTPWVFLRPVAALVGAVIVVSLPVGAVPEALLLACRAGLLIVAFAYFGMRAIRYFGSEYVVTDRRVLARRGVLARLRVDLPLDEIEEVTVGRGSSTQGSLWIRRADGAQVTFWRIREPGAFREAIERARA